MPSTFVKETQLGTRRILSVPFYLGEALADWEPAGSDEVIQPVLPLGTAQERLSVLMEAVAKRVALVEDTMVYGLDCMLPLGVLAGLQRRKINPTLIWFDAHGDFHTWETTRSGYLGGMPLAMAVGRGEQTIVDAIRLRPIAEDRVVLVDARDLDPGEDEAVRRSKLRHWTVDRLMGADALEGPFYLHLDVDVVNPQEMPGIRFPAIGGPELSEVKGAVHHLESTGQVVAVSIACTWDPAHVEAARAAQATQSLAAGITPI